MVTLTHGAVTCELNNPELGDPFNIGLPITFKKSLSGNKFTYINGVPERYVLWTFNTLNDSQINNLRLLLASARSSAINVVDHLTRSFAALIRLRTVTLEKEGSCKNSVVLELEVLVT